MHSNITAKLMFTCIMQILNNYRDVLNQGAKMHELAIIDQPDKAINIQICPASFPKNLYLIAQKTLKKWYNSAL